METFPAQDPSWEARFTEGMARARFRCTYLNGEESGRLTPASVDGGRPVDDDGGS